MKTLNSLKFILIIASMTLTACEKEQGPQGPQGPQGLTGSQGPAGPSGTSGMSTNAVFAAEGEFTSQNSGRTRRRRVPSSEFPIINPTEHAVIGHILMSPHANAASRRYVPMPYTYYSSNSSSIGYTFTYGTRNDGDVGELWLYINRTDNAIMSWDVNNMTTGWNYRFFVFKSKMIPSRMNQWNFDKVEEFANNNPQALVQIVDFNTTSDEMDHFRNTD